MKVANADMGLKNFQLLSAFLLGSLVLIALIFPSR